MNLYLTNFKSIASKLFCTYFTFKYIDYIVDVHIHQDNYVTVRLA